MMLDVFCFGYYFQWRLYYYTGLTSIFMEGRERIITTYSANALSTFVR